MRTLRVLVALLAFLRVAHANTFTVNSTTDVADLDPVNAPVCATAGSYSIRAAIQDANAHAGDDTIVVPAGNYLLSVPLGTEATTDVNDAVGDLDIKANMTITGAGSGLVTVDGGAAYRVFHIAASQTGTMFGLTIRDGADQAGGGIFAVGNVTLNDVVVTEISA